MMSAADFEQEIKRVTSKGIGSSLKSAGRTAQIATALRAYEQAVKLKASEGEQAAYLYRVLKLCNGWLAAKVWTTGDNTSARKSVINLLRFQAMQSLRDDYPMIQQALNRYNTKKSQTEAQPTIGLKGHYAHEGAAFRQFKAEGRFADPGPLRFAPSATKMKDDAYFHDKIGPVFKKRRIEELTFEEYLKMDKLLGHRHRVLYLSKLQRLQYMVHVETHPFVRFVKATDDSVIDMAGSRVAEDIHWDIEDLITRFYPMVYACDRSGNLFVCYGGLQTSEGRQLTINHSTLLSGKDVLCAGTISIKKGKLRAISNNSGHYKPDTIALTRMVRLLQDEGVDLRNVVVLDSSRPREEQLTEGKYYLAGKYGKFPPWAKAEEILRSTT
jgi:hypothetical protein